MNAFTIAIERLSRKDSSVRDLKQFLKKKEISSEEIEAVILKLIDYKYLDDDRYARMLIRNQHLKKKGATAIRQKLYQKGISLENEKINEVLAEIQEKDGSPTAEFLALSYLEKRYPDFREDRKTAQRAFKGLLRRGYSFAITEKLIRSPKT